MTRDILRQLASWVVAYVPNLKLDYPVIEDDEIPTSWNGLSDASVLGFYNGMGRTRLNDAEVIYASAALIYMASLCKDINITEAWMNRCHENMSRILCGINLKTYVSHTVAIEYAKLCSRERVPDLTISTLGGNVELT